MRQPLNQTEQSKDHGSGVMEVGESEWETQSRLGSAGRVWNNISDVVYEKSMPPRMKAELYRTIMHPPMRYGAEVEWQRDGRFNTYKCLRLDAFTPDEEFMNTMKALWGKSMFMMWLTKSRKCNFAGRDLYRG